MAHHYLLSTITFRAKAGEQSVNGSTTNQKYSDMMHAMVWMNPEDVKLSTRNRLRKATQYKVLFAQMSRTGENSANGNALPFPSMTIKMVLSYTVMILQLGILAHVCNYSTKAEAGGL